MSAVIEQASSIVSLKKTGILRPEKIVWKFIPTQRSIIDAIPSKSLRKTLRELPHIEQSLALHHEIKNVTQKTYLSWLSWYEKKQTALGRRILVDTHWLEQKIEEKKRVQMMTVYQQTRPIAAGLVVLSEQDTKATLAYSAVEHLHLANWGNFTVGALLNFYFLQDFYDRGIRDLSSGRSRNAFGVYNTYGYLEHKLRLGFSPISPEDTTFFDKVPLDTEGNSIFFGLKHNVFSCYIIDDERRSIDTKHYHFGNIPVVHLHKNDIMPA